MVLGLRTMGLSMKMNLALIYLLTIQRRVKMGRQFSSLMMLGLSAP